MVIATTKKTSAPSMSLRLENMVLPISNNTYRKIAVCQEKEIEKGKKKRNKTSKNPIPKISGAIPIKNRRTKSVFAIVTLPSFTSLPCIWGKNSTSPVDTKSKLAQIKCESSWTITPGKKRKDIMKITVVWFLVIL